jgi:hypothetical protein
VRRPTSAHVKVCGCRPHDGGAADTVGPAYANLQWRKLREVWRGRASDAVGIWPLRAIIVLNHHRFWGYASGPSSSGSTLPSSIHRHAARRSALPRERFSPLTHNGRGHRQIPGTRRGIRLMTYVLDLRRWFPVQNLLADNRHCVLYFVRAGSCSLARR